MKKKKMKKLWVVFSVVVGLFLGMSTVVLAAEDDRTITNETKETFLAPSYLEQTGAANTSVTVRWGAVSGAEKYQVNLSSDGGKNYKILGSTEATHVKITNLQSDCEYRVKVFAYSMADVYGYSISARVWTAPKKVSLSSYEFNGSGCTFYMKNPGANVDGYKVTYKNYKTGGSATRYVPGYKSFSLPFSAGQFYKVTIMPYVKVDNKMYCGSESVTTYVASQPKLQKHSNTKSSMTVKWSKCYGATSYSVYLKKPGSSSFTKVATTTALIYTVKGMKIGSGYQIRVVANRQVNGKTYQSQKNGYYTIRLYYV